MMANFRRSAGAALILLTAGCPGRVPVKKTTTPAMELPGSTMPAETMPAATMPAKAMPAATMPVTTRTATTQTATTEPAMAATTGAATEPVAPAARPVLMPTTGPVATADFGRVPPTPGLFPKKPFVKLPEHFSDAGKPSTLLLEHASFDSPVPLEEFGKQPVRRLEDFHLHDGMTVDEVKKEFGDPAQLADVEDPWLVYRLTNTRELWLHFDPASHGRLVAADVVRGAESGYVRTHVFTANN